MEKKQVMVLASSGCRGLETLDSIRDEVHVHLLDSVGEAQPVIGQVEIVFAWDSALNGLLEGLWPQAESLQWVQSGSAGVESLLFPEFAESSVVLTSGRDSTATFWRSSWPEPSSISPRTWIARQPASEVVSGRELPSEK